MFKQNIKSIEMAEISAVCSKTKKKSKKKQSSSDEKTELHSSEAEINLPSVGLSVGKHGAQRAYGNTENEISCSNEQSNESKLLSLHIEPIEQIINDYRDNVSSESVLNIPTQSKMIRFEELNEELHNMKPFFKAESELGKIDSNFSDNFENTTGESLTNLHNPSAPEICNTIKYLSPKQKSLNNSLVLQRCLESSIENDDIEEISDTVDSKICEEINVKPFTEGQLLSLYDNMLIDESQLFISKFLEHEKNIGKCKFYELLLNYQRARANLMGTENDLKSAKQDYIFQSECIWTFEEQNVTEEGLCLDDQLVSVFSNHEIAVFQSSVVGSLSKQLKSIREKVFESHTLHMYTSELSKVMIENFLHSILRNCEIIASLPKSAPVACFFNGNMTIESDSTDMKLLKRCISILMTFARKNIQDPVFIREIRTWISDAIALLLRIASHKDHLFILNHLLRCPAGVGDWGSQYLQVIPPEVNCDQDTLGSSYLDHLIVILSVILNPVRDKETFLQHLKNSPDSDVDSTWIVLDSDDDEEEDLSKTWHYFCENDVIQFLNQVPFEEMFKHILLITTDGEHVDYDAKKATESSMMKLFAFCTRLLKIFREGLNTYHHARFKGVIKRISRLIRHTVHYVTDHWKGFQDNNLCHRNSVSRDSSMAVRLQVEYDEFFENAVKIVFLSPRCGAWQFLAVIPYNCVSLKRLWTIAYRLHVGYDQSCSPMSIEIEDWPSILKSSDTRGRLHDRLSCLGDSEAYYLLTSLANMAIVRSSNEKEFIESVVCNLFSTTMVNEELRSDLNRAGRDLFSTITMAHPFTVSTILSEIQENLSSIGTLCLYLSRFLCLERWKPKEEDLQCLSYWLQFTPTASVENQLARTAISKMNWDFKGEKGSLALSKSVHQRIALLVVEVAMKMLPKAGSGNLLSEGVKQVTSVVYAPSQDQVLLKWCWFMLNRLRLHQMDQSYLEVRHMLANQALVLKGIGDPSTSPHLETLNKGLKANQPLCVLAAVLMTSRGHSIPEICNHLADSLEMLVSAGFHESTLMALSVVSPLFFNQHEDLVTDVKFVHVLQRILSSDQTYVKIAKSYVSSSDQNAVTNMFQALVVSQIQHFQRFNLDNAAPIVRFWVDAFVLVPNWRSNVSVLKLMDVLCEASVSDPASWQVLKDVFIEQRKLLMGEKGEKSKLGGLLNWVSSVAGGEKKSLLSRALATVAPWYALCVYICEAQEEMSSGLWKGLLTRLYGDSSISVDAALNEVCAELVLIPVAWSDLALYRLCYQLIDLPCGHLAFPATTQIFLTLQLSRVPPRIGEYDCCSVIHRFYEGYFSLSGNLLTKVEKQVEAAQTFWASKAADEESKSPEDGSSTATKDRHMKLGSLCKLSASFTAMKLWLSEAKLYEPGLHVASLPPQFMPQKLLYVYQESWDIWPELLHREQIHDQLSDVARCWEKYRSCCPVHNSQTLPASPQHIRLSRVSDSSDEGTSPSQAILKRLKEYDVPKPPPKLPSFHKSSSRNNSPTGSLNKDSVTYDIERHTSLIESHSKNVLLNSKEMCALDCVYLELLPQLWTNVAVKTVMNAMCKPKKNSKLVECSGPANIVVEYTEKRLSEGVKARIDQNREQRVSLINASTQAPPLQLFDAALRLEELVSDVVSWHKDSRNRGDHDIDSIVRYGRKLFYHFVKMTSEETNFYHPAKQLITSCADILGQEFLHCHEDIQMELMSQVLKSNPEVGVLLSPHFAPGISSNEFYLMSYESLAKDVMFQPDLCFMLLSKFEVETWLKERLPDMASRRRLLASIFSALKANLIDGKESAVVCLEMYRVHLQAVLNHSFLDHFQDFLLELLNISVQTEDCGDVRRNIWFDFLNTISRGVAVIRPDMSDSQRNAAIRNYVQNQVILSPQTVKSVIESLSRHFMEQRKQTGLYGLYSHYKRDSLPIAILMAMMSAVHAVASPLLLPSVGLEELSRCLWSGLLELWSPWISPIGGSARDSCPQWIQDLSSDKSVLLPWTPGYTSGPANVLNLFASTVSFYHETFSGISVLSYVLEFYQLTYASPCVKDHVLGVVHSQFSSLPWHRLRPSLKDLEIFYKIIHEYLPECHTFIGNVFIQVSWEKVVDEFVAESETQNASLQETRASDGVHKSGHQLDILPDVAKLHILLLNILVRISMEPSVRQSGLLHPLLVSADRFQWHLVDSKSFETVLNWFVMSCDPRIVLRMPARNQIDVALLSLLHVAAGYSVNSDCPTECVSFKRRLLVRAMSRLISTSATRHKALLSAKRELFRNTYFDLLVHLELVVDAVAEPDRQFEEGVALCSELVNLIGSGSSPPGLQEVCRDTLTEWLRTRHSTKALLLPFAATVSKGVLHLHFRSPLLESCISAIFDYTDSIGGSEAISWKLIIEVLFFPRSNPMPMLTFAAQECHMLEIFVHTKWRLHTSEKSSSLNFVVLGNVMELLPLIDTTEACERGLVLVIGEIVDLITIELEKRDNYDVLWAHCNALVDHLTVWGEDRASSGILAAIGLGRKSSLSIRVRLICRCLSSFMKSQLLSTGYFSVLNEHKNTNEEPRDESDSSMAVNFNVALQQLLSLRLNSEYAPLTSALSFALEFLQDSHRTMVHCSSLFDGLLERLFPGGCSVLQMRQGVI